MPKTPLTGSTSYATPADMILAYDVRTLGDLLTDTDVRLTPTQVLASAKLQAALNKAAGQIESAVVRGRKYSPADLQAFTGNCLALLVDLNCKIALGKVFGNRPDNQPLLEEVKEGKEMLEQLKTGENIFPTDESADAGVHVPVISPPIPGQCLVTDVAVRYFGSIWRPLNPWGGGCCRRGC